MNEDSQALKDLLDAPVSRENLEFLALLDFLVPRVTKGETELTALLV